MQPESYMESSQAFERAGHDVSDEPRDERGRWTEGGGGDDRKHPGEGYSASAWVDAKGVIHTSNVYDAQRALFENKKVELKQLKQVSTLIRRLGETAAEMAEHGEKAPVFNLCNVSIEGTNLFCSEHKDIPRAEMPVIPAKRTKEFVKYLRGQGYETEKSTERADHLRATQSEISGAKVAVSMARIDKEGFYKRLVVSRDDYILDGHHAWAAQLGIDARDGTLKDDKHVKITRVDIPIIKLIEEADKWTQEQGIAKKPASQAAAYTHISLREAEHLLDAETYAKFADVAYRFFAASGQLARGLDEVMITVPVTRAREREDTEIELWPEKGESEDDFMDRCIGELTVCIGGRAETVCADKWEASQELGKKGFVTLSMLSGDLKIEPCGTSCLGCRGVEAREWDEGKHPREPAGSPTGGQFTSGGGGGTEFDKEAADMRLVGTGIDPSRVENWRKELEAQLDALEKAGKAGEEEWDKINRMEITLGFYLNASEKDKAAGHASLTEIHDGNDKLYATVFIQHNPETKVSTIEGIGTLEKAALTKALTHAILHEQVGNRAERIEKVEFKDNTFITDAMEDAGFQKQPMQDESVVRMVWGAPEKTAAEKAKEEREAVEHSRMIEGAAKASAKLLGYDPKLIEVSDQDYTFKIGAETMSRHAAGLAHLSTGRITIFPRYVYSADAAVSVTAHEVAHQKYETVFRAFRDEMNRVHTDSEIAAANAMNPDGTLQPPFDQKYPIYQRFRPLEATDKLDKRADDDGVSDYSRAYWDNFNKRDVPFDQQVSLHSASHETIAEMHRLMTEKGHLRDAKPSWRSYYRAVMKTYDEIQAAAAAAKK